MNIIHFQGLNCYHSCIVNVASLLGIDYLQSFSSLWSETEFSYDPVFHMCVTKRMITQLKSLGMNLKKHACKTKKESESAFAEILEGEWFIAGMNSFYMTWNEYYQTLNGYHYFFAKKEDGMLCCFDPTYDKVNIKLKSEIIVPYIFDIVSVNKCDINPVKASVEQEAKNILEAIPMFCNKIISEIDECTGKNKKLADNLAINVDAMITNRYLYLHYLDKSLKEIDNIIKLFNEAFFKKWTAVKNGLYKASLVNDNKDILRQVKTVLVEVLKEELRVAKALYKKRLD